MYIDGHRWDVSWVTHENVWEQYVQYSCDGNTFANANDVQSYEQTDIDNAPGSKIEMNFEGKVARYWRWYVQDQNCATIQSWEFKGRVPSSSDASCSVDVTSDGKILIRV